MSWRLATVLLAASVALALTAAAAASTSSTVIATGTTLKGSHGKIALAEVTANKPKTLAARVTASPRQSVKLQWSVTCLRGSQANQAAYIASARPKSGTSSVVTPATLKLAMAFPHATACEIAVYSTLSKGGTQKLEVVQT